MFGIENLFFTSMVKRILLPVFPFLIGIILISLHMQWLSNSIFCLLIIGFMLFLLAGNFYQPEISVGGALILMILGNYISSQEFLSIEKALSGFSNPGVITIAALFIVAAAAKNTGLFESLAYGLLGKGKSISSSLAKISFPLTTLSAFINNTPIVSIFIPIIREWAQKNNLSPSKFLIPLSYFTIFGGTCTLIGTSTNLVVNGLNTQIGNPSIPFFAFGLIGLPCAALGIIYLVFFGHKLLPTTDDPFIQDENSIKKYLIEMYVEPGSKLTGLSLEQAGLRNFEDIFLFEVRRADNIYAPVKREFVLEEGDCLVFSGSRDGILNLPKVNGLTIPKSCQSFELGENAQMVEVVISTSSPLRGRTLDDLWFNRKYDAAVLAIHRNGEDLGKGLSSTPLMAGDTLLIVAGIGFRRIWQHSTDFYLVSPIRTDLHKPKFAPYAALIIGGMVILPALGLVPILYTSLVAALLLVLINCVDQENVFDLVDWNVLAVITAAFGISAALEGSGSSTIIAKLIISASHGLGPYGALIILYLATNILTETITNNAAAALIFPIGIMSAAELSVNPMPYIMAISIAASASFATPVGYQTNMMVYGPGGYKYHHYLKIGLPLNFIFFVGTCLLAPLFWPFN